MRASKSRNKRVAKISCNKADKKAGNNGKDKSRQRMDVFLLTNHRGNKSMKISAVRMEK